MIHLKRNFMQIINEMTFIHDAKLVKKLISNKQMSAMIFYKMSMI